MRIDRARVDDAFVSPHVIEQTIAPLDTATSLHERAQKFKFKAGEVDPPSIHRDYVARRINYNRTDRQMFFLLFRIGPAHERSDTQNDSTRTKRLGHIIVGAKFQAYYPIDLFGLGC